MDFFVKQGVPLQIERGRRVFPKSNRASDINKAMEIFLIKNRVDIQLNHPVTGIEKQKNTFIIQTSCGMYTANAIIIATGGLSYPSTGSTGDGYTFAKKLGHDVKPTYPSLAPLLTKEKWVNDLTGLSLKNIRIQVFLPNAKKPLFEDVGEMMFTHHGVTGPLVLSASRCITDKFDKNPHILLDLKPGLSMEKLDERILRDFSENMNKDFCNSLNGLLPERLIETIITLSGIPPGQKVNAVTRTERLQLVSLLKGLILTPTATAGYNEAVITMGGVHIKHVNPSNLMSKKVNGLFFAGEVLDVDAMTGGYNMQIAFSTGYLAGKSAALYNREMQ
jgi:hypothetical protein